MLLTKYYEIFQNCQGSAKIKLMLKIYNTLSQKKEIFKPRQNKKINLFVCGPTVYDFSHIGHARTYIAFDVIVKYLRKQGFNVFYLQNITDIDDKIIQRAKERKIKPERLSEMFNEEYLKDMKDLNVDSVTKYAKATSHIKEIISQIKRLLEKDFAYQINDGIYYNINKFKEYGKLSKRNAFQAEDAISRIDEAKKKRNKGDFCLWKVSKPEEPKWKSPWGPGRPGWHIEDTAITEKYFGSQYDIHGGAKDLIFPHHEAEIAQMEAISEKKPLVKYWIHTGFLTVNAQKMAKSLGNFVTIKNFLEKHSPEGARILRFLVVKTHYRSPIDYNENSIKQTKRELERIDEFIGKLKGRYKNEGKTSKQTENLISITKEKIEKAMKDDFNTPLAIASIFELITKGNTLIAKCQFNQEDAKDVLKALKESDKFFNFIFWQKPKGKAPQEVLKLIEEREGAREQKNWQKADEVRGKIKKLGYLVEDTKEGPKIKKQ